MWRLYTSSGWPSVKTYTGSLKRFTGAYDRVSEEVRGLTRNTDAAGSNLQKFGDQLVDFTCYSVFGDLTADLAAS